jgi:hypothetical protein
VAPGGNFDLSFWELEEPVGRPGRPMVVGPDALKGPHGFADAYFFTDPHDGAMTFWAPANGVTTPNSRYPRSELRELNADQSLANWPLSGTHVLAATLAVVHVPDHVCVGQAHVGRPLRAGLAPSTKPLFELYAFANGDVALGIERGPDGGQTRHVVARVPLGARFSYRVSVSGTALALTVDDATATFALPAGFEGYGAYFKAGDYDQTAGPDGAVGATVKFYALSVTHIP